MILLNHWPVRSIAQKKLVKWVMPLRNGRGGSTQYLTEVCQYAFQVVEGIQGNIDFAPWLLVRLIINLN